MRFRYMIVLWLCWVCIYTVYNAWVPTSKPYIIQKKPIKPNRKLETSWSRLLNTETYPETAQNQETFMETFRIRFGDVSEAFPFPSRSQTGT